MLQFTRRGNHFIRLNFLIPGTSDFNETQIMGYGQVAVYTKITEAELGTFLAKYELGSFIDLVEITEGIENSNYVLVTQEGRFILTIFERRVSLEDLPFFLDLMRYLSENGVCCPIPIKARDGNVLGKLQGKPAAVLTHLNGVSKENPGVADCGAVGGVLADLHLAGQPFSGGRRNDLSLKDWPNLLAQIGADANELSEGIVSDLRTEIEYLEHSWPEGLPQGIIHGDLFPDNVLFQDENVSGIIDFYFSCQDSFAYDLAICLNSWSFDRGGIFDHKKSEAIISAYCQRRTLSKNECESLPILCRASAVRFLLTRLYDWMNMPEAVTAKTKDPLEYYNKLLFHRSVRAADDYGV